MRLAAGGLVAFVLGLLFGLWLAKAHHGSPAVVSAPPAGNVEVALPAPVTLSQAVTLAEAASPVTEAHWSGRYVADHCLNCPECCVAEVSDGTD